MASLDAARAHAQQEGIWEEPLRAGTAINAALQELPGLELLSHKHVGMFMPMPVVVAQAYRYVYAVQLEQCHYQCHLLLHPCANILCC